MTPAALSAVLLLAVAPAAALGAPSCPGPDLSVAPEGATEVEQRHADVPNARFPGQWQQGRLGDLSYRLYPGGFGTIGPGPHMADWRIEMSCNPEARTCTYWSFGEVPDGMQPQARKLGRCLLGPEPPTPVAGRASQPGTGSKATAREAASAAPKAAKPAAGVPEVVTPPVRQATPRQEPAAAAPPASSPVTRETAPSDDEPRTLARAPAPAAADASAAPARTRQESAPPPADPRTPAREPAPVSPEAPADTTPAARETVMPSAGPGTAEREPAPIVREAAEAPVAREPAPPLSEPRAFLCWTVPAVSDSDTPAAGSEVLVCRPAPASADMPDEPVPSIPTPAQAGELPDPQPPASAQEAHPSAPDGAPRQPGITPESDPAEPREPSGDAGNDDALPEPVLRDADDPASAPDEGDAPAQARQSAQDDPPVPRPDTARATGSPPPIPFDTWAQANLLPLSRWRAEDHPQASSSAMPPGAHRPAIRPATVSATRTPAPRRIHQRPQPLPPTKSSVPPLALTRCSLGSAVALGQENIGDIGQISVNVGCSGRFGDRLTFSGGLTTYPVSGGRHGGRLTYSYALNWRITDQVTLTYANYTAALAGGRALAGLGEGRLQLSAKVARFPLGTRDMPDRAMTCTGFVSMARSAPSNAGVNCGVNVTERLAFRFTALAYPPGTQREWDADFSYSASYALSDRVALSYSNYANNRWPWNRSPRQVEPFHGGTLGLSYRWDF